MAYDDHALETSERITKEEGLKERKRDQIIRRAKFREGLDELLALYDRYVELRQEAKLASMETDLFSVRTSAKEL